MTPTRWVTLIIIRNLVMLSLLSGSTSKIYSRNRSPQIKCVQRSTHTHTLCYHSLAHICANELPRSKGTHHIQLIKFLMTMCRNAKTWCIFICGRFVFLVLVRICLTHYALVSPVVIIFAYISRSHLSVHRLHDARVYRKIVAGKIDDANATDHKKFACKWVDARRCTRAKIEFQISFLVFAAHDVTSAPPPRHSLLIYFH